MTELGVLDAQVALLRSSNSRLADALVVLAGELKARNMSRDDAVAVTSALAAVAASGELTLRADGSTEMWVPLTPGRFRVGDTVRVRADAYPPESGKSLAAGRRGVVVAVRGGLVHVRYTGDTGGMASTSSHPLDKLQQLIIAKDV